MNPTVAQWLAALRCNLDLGFDSCATHFISNILPLTVRKWTYHTLDVSGDIEGSFAISVI